MKTTETKTENFTPSKRWLNIFINLPNGKKLYLQKGIGFDNLPTEENNELYNAILSAFEGKEQEGVGRFILSNLRVEAYSQNVEIKDKAPIDLGLS